MKTIPIAFVEAWIDVRFAGCNPENADYTNPDGAFYTKVPVIQAETASGLRFELNHQFGSIAAAESLAATIRAAGAIDPTRWSETFPRYGSPAWQQEDGNRNAALRVAISHGDRDAIDRLS
jgi:hypothetical protein